MIYTLSKIANYFGQKSSGRLWGPSATVGDGFQFTSLGAVQLRDELQRAVERQVAEGRAANAAAFVEEAVLRLIDAADLEAQDILAAAQAGISDIEAGRFTAMDTPQGGQRLHERMMARLRANLAADKEAACRCTRAAEDQIDAIPIISSLLKELSIVVAALVATIHTLSGTPASGVKGVDARPSPPLSGSSLR